MYKKHYSATMMGGPEHGKAYTLEADEHPQLIKVPTAGGGTAVYHFVFNDDDHHLLYCLDDPFEARYDYAQAFTADEMADPATLARRFNDARRVVADYASTLRPLPDPWKWAPREVQTGGPAHLKWSVRPRFVEG